MKKTFIILAALCCCFSVKAQNVGTEFEITYYGKYRITSTDPAEVTLVKVKSDIPASGREYNTAEYNGKTYAVTSLNVGAFRDYSNSNSIFTFSNLKRFEGSAFNNTTCYQIDMSNSPLTALPKDAFYNCHCSRILLPSSITRISSCAFQKSSVTSINLPNITRIDGSAFLDCTALSSIDLSHVTYIDGTAFYGCSALASIDLSNVTYIGGSAFNECTNLKNVTLPQCLKTVATKAFWDCYLTSLTMYNTTETFGESPNIMASNGTVTMNIVDWSNKNVLSGNTGISLPIIYKYNNETVTGEYTLPDDVTSLGQGALYHCTDITAINMPAGLTQIGAKALAKCTNLSVIRCEAVPAPAVANVNAFSEVDKNIPVYIPDNAESFYSYIHTIGWKDFANYQVTLPTIKGAAILDLQHTAGYDPSQNVQDIIATYSALINATNDETEIETLTQASIEAIVAQIAIDRGLVKIGNLYYILDNEHHTATVTYGGLEADGYATAEYTGSINVPESVTYNDATYSVTAIGKHAFQNCTGLTAINMPMSVTMIDDNAFYSCQGLKTVLLPSQLNSIGNMSFFDCSAITSINCLATTPSSLGWEAFYNVNTAIPVTVPESSLAAYQDGPWGGFTNFVTNPSLDTAKANAKNEIIATLGSYSSVNYIANLALGFCLRIDAATTVGQVNELRTEGVYAVTYAISTYQEILGEMGEACDDCPAVEVKKGAKTIKLYNPEKVEFLKN